MKPGEVAIVGAAESDRLGVIPDMSDLQLNIDASIRALKDAGLTAGDIDGVASTGAYPGEIAHTLGIRPRWVDTTSVGGCSYFLHLRHAAAAIVSGMATTVLISHGQSGRSGVGSSPFSFSASGPLGQFEAPYGVAGFATMFTVPVLRFMKEKGISHEQLASVAVAQRKWAALNPRAFKREPITVDDVLESKMIAYPFHILECCLVTDGGGAIVVTSTERAADLGARPVYILGSGESSEHTIVSQMSDFTSSRAFRDAGAMAFAEAGLTPSDIDHLMVYDAFAHVPLYGLEDLGFVGPGESGAFVAEGHTSPGGRLPMNTNGGGLSYTHTGMYGMFALQESIRQVRGEAAAQVPGVEVGFVHGVGGMFSNAGSFIFANRRP
ncbi:MULTISPECIES: thiolase C-terminal domain-containing protein [unclassified Pseudofrankia]|uniref:thiolase C-terminal domain-containing protein n=1 Tax=unclassified Pseudofrankia TaxID=2994372 RepID=UPI0008DB0070|nr:MULTISPECIES: thiolase [unclassified Pseudofrankia]MDT3446812.1 acetyl-CoA acetyltransferase [Pseudofrankia sp. BMG5.37]OHV56676.1 thiolase [Pseudofrankia sp. BMG5.36]